MMMMAMLLACLTQAWAAPGMAAGRDRFAVPGPRGMDPIPMMAYYYIWYDAGSWDRAKKDLPSLGRYSSDDPTVMAQHIRWAQDAGIGGFIVSWKWTDRLDRRLEQLATIADSQGFALWVIYQGLDFQRDPLPTSQVAMDLEHFARTFAHHTSLRAMYGKPVVIWSGTWKVSTKEVRSVAAGLRPAMLVLASERTPAGFRRLAGAVDGDAYYWSSGDPTRDPRYLERLVQLGETVHADRGLWVAPAAPGFDATLLGGTAVVPRRGATTLQQELAAADASSPDAVGLISWNEFSENTQVEPSQRYGTTALDSLAGRALTPLPAAVDFDSSAPGTTARGDTSRLAPAALSVLVVLFGFLFALRRAARSGGEPAEPARSVPEGGVS